MPDAIGLAFFCFALAFTLEDKLNTSSVVISGIFLGLAIASKFIYMAFLPIAVLAVLFAGEKNKNKSYAGLISNLLVFAAGVIITVFIFIPFIWTSPLALAKNIFGTLSMYYVKHNFCWNSLLLEKLPLYINWFGLVLCLIGLVTSFYILNKKTAIFLVSGLVMFLLSLGKADFLLPRYVLPLIPYLCIYSGMGIELIVRPFKNKLKFLLVVLILGAILTSHLIGIAKDFKFTHGRTNASDCRNWVNNNIKADSGIAVPEYLSHLFVPNEVTLKKWLGALGNSYNNIDERLDGLCLMTKMKYGDLKRDNPLVPRVFGALEQQRMFVYESLLWYYRNVSRPKNAYNLFLYTPVNLYEFGMIALKDEDAVRLLLGGEVVALVSDLRLSLPSYIAIMNFDQTLGIPYYLYLNKEAKP